MQGRHGGAQPRPSGHEATVLIDHARAIIVERTTDGVETVEVLDRRSAESEEVFDARTAGEVLDEVRVIVSGPADARTRFDRAYVAVTHRPDRLVDIEPS